MGGTIPCMGNVGRWILNCLAVISLLVIAILLYGLFVDAGNAEWGDPAPMALDAQGNPIPYTDTTVYRYVVPFLVAGLILFLWALQHGPHLIEASPDNWLWWLWRLRARYRYKKEQKVIRRGWLCQNCGSDLRATPDCCPECGTVPPKRAVLPPPPNRKLPRSPRR